MRIHGLPPASVMFVVFGSLGIATLIAGIYSYHRLYNYAEIEIEEYLA